MKRKTMAQDSFLKGAFIATFGIIICKVLGILYAIPFYSIVGDQGGALYGYAYNIYSIFLGISNAGIPLAMSKIISEYHSLGYEKAKEKAASIGNKLLTFMGILSFLILFLFAKPLASLIMGSTSGGNTISDVTFVIRVISFSILIVPIMSTFRGYFQGHKYIYPTSVSQILEQVVRVSIIIFGSYISSKVFNLPLKFTVGVALFAATAGAVVSFLYLYIKKKRNKEYFVAKAVKKEPKISSKTIIKNLMIYAVPFIMIDIFNSLFNSVDTFMLVRVFVEHFDYTKFVAETVLSVFTTWGAKINMIIIALAPGIMTSLIPNLSSSIVKKNFKDVRFKINQTLQVLAYLAIPMGVGLSFLARQVWYIFYGSSTYGPSVYKLYSFVAVFTIFYTAIVTSTQLLREYKTVLFSLIAGLVTKVSLNIPLMYLFNNLGLAEYYGSISATLIAYLVCSTICLVVLYRKYKLRYKDTFKKMLEIIGTVLIMLASLNLVKTFAPFVVEGRMANLAVLALYSIVGILVYGLITYNTRLIHRIFGDDVIEKLKGFLKKKKKA